MEYNRATNTTSEPAQPIPGALCMLASAVHDLSLTADALVSRLAGVMTPEPPSAADKLASTQLKEVGLQVSQLADEITGLRRRVDGIRDQLHAAHNRLEV